MNPYQQSLYNDLLRLTEERKAFYFQDFTLDGSVYRIFNYRLASFTDFMQPSGLECRGIMFEMDGENPVRLASLPLKKFFNLNECPMTMNLDLTQVKAITVKADGSLISSYLHWDGAEHILCLKSKGSINSTQAQAAMLWIDQPEQQVLRDEVHKLAVMDYTVNFEWVAPDNRIVLSYAEPRLVVLGVRKIDDGSYISREHLFANMHFPHLTWAWTELYNTGDNEMFIRDVVPTLTGTEGFVVEMNDGLHFKIKTDWYLALHRLKDSINSPRRLFEAVLDEATDDLRASFHDDEQALKMISDMEEFATGLYNEMVETVETYFEANKELERKEYAIKGQQDLKRMYFGLAMTKYIGREPDYKGYLKKQWKTLGLKDEVDPDE